MSIQKPCAIVLDILLALLLCTFALPIFLTWRLLLLPILPIEYLLRATHIHKRIAPISTAFHTRFQKSRHAFLALTPLATLTTHRIRLTCLSLLVIEATLAITLLFRSCQLFLPYVVSPSPLKEKILPIALFIATCGPCASLLGIVTATAYYRCKRIMYGRYWQGMRRMAVGRGYWVDPRDEEDRKMVAVARKLNT
jgi:hypothetical protein